MSNEPGCFGISICCDPRTKTCAACPFLKECRKDAEEEATTVAKLTGDDRILKRFMEPPKKPKKKLPKKAEEVARTLFAMGFDIGDMLARRVNPFARGTKLRYLYVACNLLMEGGFTRRSLEQAFCRELQWGETTAASYASITVALLTGFDVAECVAGRFRLKEGVRCLV